jgi:hypothetical protein
MNSSRMKIPNHSKETVAISSLNEPSILLNVLCDAHGGGLEQDETKMLIRTLKTVSYVCGKLYSRLSVLAETSGDNGVPRINARPDMGASECHSCSKALKLLHRGQYCTFYPQLSLGILRGFICRHQVKHVGISAAQSASVTWYFRKSLALVNYRGLFVTVVIVGLPTL